MVPQLIQLKKSSQRGFTLMELLVVIGILGLLSIAGLASYTQSLRNSRDTKRRVDLETIRQSLELYHSDNSATVNPYPVGAGNTETTIKTTLISGGYISSANFPKDPQYNSSARYYNYTRGATANTYVLCTFLEAPKSGETCPSATALSCGTVGDCNYGVTQP